MKGILENFVYIVIFGILFVSVVNSQQIDKTKDEYTEMHHEVALKNGIQKDIDLYSEKMNSALNVRDNLRRGNCPNSCSSHGYCVNSACNCYNGYYGNDCSIVQTTLSSGVTVSNQTVNTFEWRYYAIQITGGNHDIVYLINQTGTGSGDCDEYIQSNQFPTRSSYFKRDISVDKVVTITISSASAGMWYLGVYGFQSCRFSVRATITGNCPNSCSGHGDCMNGQCRCFSGYGGSDCSATVTTMTTGQSYSSNVNKAAWKYYQYTFNSGNQLTYTMQQNGGGDCDLYLKLGVLPSINTWDYANVTTMNTSMLRVTNPQSGIWYLGIYGFQACSFTLSVSTGTGCPNLCSGRGNCNGGSVCACNSGYSGDYCQTRVSPLTNGGSDSGYVRFNAWNYYTYVTNSADNFDISVTQTSVGGDCDLYVKAGANPTKTSFDFQDISYGRNFTLSIDDPGHQTWYIGVYGWMECSYTITTFESASCPDENCGGNGQCIDGTGTCLCHSGFTGDGCQYVLSPLNNGLPSTDIVSYNGWKFYSFSLQNSSALYIVVKESDTTGLIWVYVAKTYPTLRQYLYSDTQTNTNMHVIAIELDNPVISTFQIGVYANPFTLPGQSAEYQIVAWSPSF